jgi:hypothetical protein
MNKLSKIETTEVDVTYTDLVNKYYNADEPKVSEASNTNEPVKLTFFAHFVAFFDAWTQNSYDAWVKAGRPDREF